jgi:hypothetical protein
MSFGQLLLLHVMAGAGVAAAVFLTAPGGHPGARIFQMVTAVIFWPLYLPVLLAATTNRERASQPAPPTAPADELASVITQVDAELDGALQSLDGWAEDVLSREKDRLDELRLAWITQAERIREMDRLLCRPEYAGLDGTVMPEKPDGALNERLRGSQLVIRQNMDRLKQVRRRTLDDLLGTLAWVRELVSMIHLAKFTGAPASRAEELVAQIAAAVEGLSAVSGPLSADGDLPRADLRGELHVAR